MIGNWDETDVDIVLAYSAWSNGNGTVNAWTGSVMPSYPNGANQPCPFTNCDTNIDGYIFNSTGNGHLNTSAIDAGNETTKRYPFDNDNDMTVEVKLNYTNLSRNQVIFNQQSLGQQPTWQCYVDSNRKIIFMLRHSAGNYARAITSTTLSDGDHTLHFIKDGGTLKVFIDNAEASYSTQETYTFGAVTPDHDFTVGNREAADLSFGGKIYWLAVYLTAFLQARITTNHSLAKDMGLWGNNIGGNMFLEAKPVGEALNRLNYEVIFAFAPWSNGNGTLDKNSGNMPSYPYGAYQNCNIQNCDVGFGYIYDSPGNGHFKGDSGDDNILCRNLFKFQTGYGRTAEIKFDYVNDGTHCYIFNAEATGVRIYQCWIHGSTRKIYFQLKDPVSNAICISTDTVSDGKHTIHVVRDGIDLSIWLDGAEVSYDQKQDFNSVFTTDNWVVFANRYTANYGINSKVYWFGIAGVAFDSSRIANNHSLPDDMNLIGNSVGNIMTLTAKAAANSWFLMQMANRLAYSDVHLR
jgi:hypothetical protein